MISSVGVWAVVALTTISVSGYFAGPQITDGVQTGVEQRQNLQKDAAGSNVDTLQKDMPISSSGGKIKNNMKCMNMYDSGTELLSPEIYSLDNIDTAKLDRCVRYFHDQGMIQSYDKKTWQKYYDMLNGRS